ncbi:superoxide dismutase [Cu-Zn] isoform X2 [Aricia agestis]|uniref:superoxide dismutase [Cu-Zn] isoform X2 n=1 Tax=Aricia agestis TaxID=91739 RepID=UPI001C206089|nr:superoxide dismutase [Cu-Zn] isoform X2 [Aricia agestis]
MFTSKLEVLVDFGPKADEAIVNKTINFLKAHNDVKEVIFKDGAFMVETTLPNTVVLDMVAKTSGRRAVLQGFGEQQSAVAMVSSQFCCGERVMGVIRFQQSGDGPLVADGSLDGMAPGPHGLHVHDAGDLSRGCSSIGDHYNPLGTPHGGPLDPPERRHAGDLGNITADESGRATFRILDNVLKLHEIVGRSVAVKAGRDDLGRGASPDSATDGDAGRPVACGIIARSAGVFTNPKRVCQCDGVVVWDERDRPLAGAGRQCCQHKPDVGKHGSQHNKPCCKV